MTDPSGEAAIRILLEHVIGEDPTRDGLQKTPARVVKAFREMTSGYRENPADILATTFDVTFDEIVILRDIWFSSLCEHHLLPFTGYASVAYFPTKRVVGLSKLARLVNCFARRLQVQERMTREIADAIEHHVGTDGVGVVIRAEHSCMACRGVQKHGASMVTSAMLGRFRHNSDARAELLDLLK